MGAQFVGQPSLGQVVRYSPTVAMWEDATIVATRTEADSAFWSARGETSPPIRRSQNVHLSRSNGEVAYQVEPAADTGEHGPGEWCNFDPTCRAPGT